MAKTIVSLSFDDGREDTARIAYPIMKKYNLPATIHITTGFVDGSWREHNWKSCDTPMSVDDLLMLVNEGFELSLHGDKHKTDPDDFSTSKQKFSSWGIDVTKLGFSVPNSELSGEDKAKFVDFLKNNDVKYMRVGRNTSCYTLASKMCYVMYRLFRFQWAYNLFNRHNLNKSPDLFDLNTVVVRNTDRADSIIRFINKNKSDCRIILMLHSVLTKGDSKYDADAWCWDAEQFEALCRYLRQAVDDGRLEVETIINQC